MSSINMSVDDAYFTSNVAVGSSGGDPFYYNVSENQSPNSGVVVLSIQVWYNSDTIRGIEIGLTNGKMHMAGKKADSKTNKFYLLNDEKITSLSIWSLSKMWSSSHEAGRLQITTNTGRSFNVNSSMDGTEFKYEVGSGILVGIFGRSGADLDCLGFAMLRKVIKSTLVSVKYPHLNHLIVKAQPEQIKKITYDNTIGTVPQSYTFNGEKTVTKTSEWSLTAGIETGVSVTVEGGIPFIAEGSATAHVTVSVEGSYTSTYTEEEKESFEAQVEVPAGKKTVVTASFYEGIIKTEYTGMMRYELSTMKTFEYEVKGSYTGVSVSDIRIKNETLN